MEYVEGGVVFGIIITGLRVAERFYDARNGNARKADKMLECLQKIEANQRVHEEILRDIKGRDR